MKTPPVMRDEEAAAMAEESRAQGAEIVRNHLQNHAANNPGRSSDYVTWIATLHPENADVSIDQRFFIPGNPWWTIYEQSKTNLPSATAVPVAEYEEDTEASSVQQQPPPTKPHCIYLCSPIDMIVGICITANAILGVLICEITAFCFYLVAFIMYWIAKIFDPPNAFTGILYSFFMIFYYGFAIGDSACLLASVLVTEVLASSCWLVSVMFGGIWMANRWHQYIRRTCHLIRWAFRAPFSEPPRHFSMCCLGARETEEEFPESTVEAEVVNQAVVVPHGTPGAYAVRRAEAVVVKG